MLPTKSLSPKRSFQNLLNGFHPPLSTTPLEGKFRQVVFESFPNDCSIQVPISLLSHKFLLITGQCYWIYSNSPEIYNHPHCALQLLFKLLVCCSNQVIGVSPVTSQIGQPALRFFAPFFSKYKLSIANRILRDCCCF